MTTDELTGKLIRTLYEDVLNGKADDDLVWLLSDRVGMVGRLKYLRGGRTRVKFHLDAQTFDWNAEIEDLQDFGVFSNEETVVVTFIVPGTRDDYETTVENATAIAQRFFKSREN